MGEQGVVAGPDQRFGRFVLPELDALLRLATALTRQPADAEDLVQDTLLRAYRAIDQFDGAYPRAWLFTIMRRANVDTFRRSRPVQMQDPHTMAETAGAGDRDDDPGERAVAAVFDDVVAAAFDALPPRHREIVTLVDVGGLSYAEAAAAAGVPVGTVMSRLHRARARLRVPLTAAGLAPRQPDAPSEESA